MFCCFEREEEGEDILDDDVGLIHNWGVLGCVCSLIANDCDDILFA